MSAAVSGAGSGAVLDEFTYDDAIVRKFLVACFVWGLIGMIVGLLIALQLADPAFNLGLPITSFGRRRDRQASAGSRSVAFSSSALTISRRRPS